MDLLNKFATVTIESDRRISEADKLFCQRHQEAFEKAAPALQKIAEAVVAAKAEQKEAFGGDEESFTDYLYTRFDMDEEHLYDAMQKRGEKMIHAIVAYFSRKYNVGLDSDQIVEHLIPAEPKEPNRYGWSRMTDEEAKKYKAELEAYRTQEEAWARSLRTLHLRYEQIVDEIFIQLGGFSFEERALNEFLNKCWNAAHTSRWNESQPIENFEIKNATLRLTGYWCRCKDDSWRICPEWEPTEDLRTIIHALVHFGTGQFNRGAKWFPELFRYDTTCNEYEVGNLPYVKSIKLFKNGRVDIKFNDAETVLRFVNQYLRENVGGTN